MKSAGNNLVSKYLELRKLTDCVKSGKAGQGTMAKIAEATDQLGKHLNDTLLEFSTMQNRLDRCDADIQTLKIRLNAKDGAMERLEKIIELDRSKVEKMDRNLVENIIRQESSTNKLFNELRDQISEVERSTKSNAW